MAVETRRAEATTTSGSIVAAVAWVMVMLLLVVVQVPGARAVTDKMLKIACSDMTPRHPGYRPENTQGVPCPYRLIVNTSTPVVPGNLVNITLTSVNLKTPFKGFMIQARDSDGRTIGLFLPECRNVTQHHMISCPNGDEPYNTVVQSNGKFKTTDTFTWLAPLSLKGSFRFKFTVVFNFEHYWTNEETNDIPVAKLSPEEFKIKNSINHEYYIYKAYIKNCFS